MFQSMKEEKHWSITQEHSLILLRSNWSAKRAIAFRNWTEVAEIAQLLFAAIPREEGAPTDQPTEQVSSVAEIIDSLDEMTAWAETGIAESYKKGGLPSNQYELALDMLDKAQKLLKKYLGDSWHSRQGT